MTRCITSMVKKLRLIQKSSIVDGYSSLESVLTVCLVMKEMSQLHKNTTPNKTSETTDYTLQWTLEVQRESTTITAKQSIHKQCQAQSISVGWNMSLGTRFWRMARDYHSERLNHPYSNGPHLKMISFWHISRLCQITHTSRLRLINGKVLILNSLWEVKKRRLSVISSTQSSRNLQPSGYLRFSIQICTVTYQTSSNQVRFNNPYSSTWYR